MTYETEAELREENISLRDVIADLTGAVEPPIDGLSDMPSRLYRTLESANGHVVRHGSILTALYGARRARFQSTAVIHAYTQLIRKRRPDLGWRIKPVRGIGLRLEPDNG